MISDDDAILISRAIDGELSGSELTNFKARLLSEPELREVHDSMAMEQELLLEMSSKIDGTPVPDGITEQLSSKGSNLTQWMSLAAAIAVVTLGGLLLTNPDQTPTLADVLNDIPSGSVTSYNGGHIEVIATFRANNTWCREYVSDEEHAVACRDGSEWRTAVSQKTAMSQKTAVSQKTALSQNEESAADTDSYLPAGEDTIIQDYVLDNMNGQPLNIDQEMLQLRQWR